MAYAQNAMCIWNYLPSQRPHEKIDIEIVVNYETIPLSDKIKISKIKDNYEIVLCNHARYVVYPFQSKIECTAVTFEAFFQHCLISRFLYISC